MNGDITRVAVQLDGTTTLVMHAKVNDCFRDGLWSIGTNEIVRSVQQLLLFGFEASEWKRTCKSDIDGQFPLLSVSN